LLEDLFSFALLERHYNRDFYANETDFEKDSRRQRAMVSYLDYIQHCIPVLYTVCVFLGKTQSMAANGIVQKTL
jgi:hypothetical protein